MQLLRITSFFMVLLGLGCSPAPLVKSVQSVRKDPTDLQIAAAKGGHLDCDFKKECEPAVALVSIATAEGISRCSGFLISDHEMMTNDHCLSSIPDQEEACQGFVFIHFNNDVHRSCKRIVTRSHQSGIASKDYAVIELDSPLKDRKPLRISKRGFVNNEAATIYTVQPSENPKTNTFDGKQIRLNCQASYSTLMNINITSSAESMMTFGDCDIHEGNSGSPIFNDHGEVGAIVQGFLNVKDDSFSDLLKPFLLDGSYGEMAISTQTRCMPELVGAYSNGCIGVKPISALYPQQYMDAFGQFSKKVLPGLSSGVIWEEIKSSKDLLKLFVSAPECITRFEATTTRLSFTSSVMSYRQGINSRLQAEWRALYQEGEKDTLFVIQKAASSVPTSAHFLSSEFGLITVPVCSKQN